ncbi:MAG: tape measure protein [Sulfuricurvum sp.]
MAIGSLDIIIAADTARIRQDMSTAVNIMQSSSQTMVGHAESVRNSIDTASNSVKIFAASYLSLSSISSLAKISDEMTNIDSKLKLVTKSEKELITTQKALFDISQNARSGYEGTVDLYSRISRSTKDYNVSQKDLLAITNTVNKSMIISGGTAESMNSAIVQFGQAFNSDFKSVGQELGSIREQTPRLYEAIVKGTGLTGAQFKKAAEDGKLSSKIIIDAIMTQTGAVDSEYGKMNQTISQSQTILKNSFSKMVGDIDNATGASRFLSSTLGSMSKEFDGINVTGSVETLKEYENIIIGVATALGVMKTASIGAGIAEEVLGSIRERSMVISTMQEEITKAKIFLAEQEAKVLSVQNVAYLAGENAQNARTAADKASIVAKESGLLIAEKHAIMLNSEAITLEESALKQNKKAYATIASTSATIEATTASIASKESILAEASANQFLSNAMKAIPMMVVIAGITALATWFFNAKSKSDDLKESIDATSDSLLKMTKAQLEVKNTNINLGIQDLGLELRQKKQSYGATKGRTPEQQAEIDSLQQQYNDLLSAGKKITQAREDIAKGIKPKGNDSLIDKKIAPVIDVTPKVKADTAENDFKSFMEKMRIEASKNPVNPFGDIFAKFDKSQDEIKKFNEKDQGTAQKALNEATTQQVANAWSAYEKNAKEALTGIQNKIAQTSGDYTKAIENNFQKDVENAHNLTKIFDDSQSKKLAAFGITKKKQEEILQKAKEIENTADIIRNDALKKESNARDLKYYQEIGDAAQVWALQEETLRTQLFGLTTAQQDEILKRSKRNNDEQIANNQNQLKFMESASQGLDWFANRAKFQVQNSAQNIVGIMDTVSSSMTSSFGNFFDSTNKGFMDFGNLAKSILSDIEKQMIQLLIIKPFVNSVMQSVGGSSAGGGGIGSMIGGLFGFSDGGYTGDGGKYVPMGVVHGGEYVIPQWLVKKSPSLIGSLELTRKRGYADGGLVGSTLSGTSTTSMPVAVTINIENKSGTQISAESVTPKFDGKSMVINVIVDAITRNAGGMRDAIKGVR